MFDDGDDDDECSDDDCGLEMVSRDADDNNWRDGAVIFKDRTLGSEGKKDDCTVSVGNGFPRVLKGMKKKRTEEKRK